MLPLMVGLLVAAVASGRAISHLGRYKAFPIAGTGTLVVGMFLLSRLGVGTAPWLASVYMLVVGIGIGLVMQVLVLVVQNDARPENIGVATSTATFFRSMGGSFGVAIFGAIFATRLSGPARPLPAGRRRAPRQRRSAQPGGGRSPAAPDPLRLPAGLRTFAPRRVPVGDGDLRHSLHALVVPQGAAASHDARAPIHRARQRGGRGRRHATRAARRGIACRATRRRAEPRRTSCARRPPGRRRTRGARIRHGSSRHRSSSRCAPPSAHPSHRPGAAAP